MVKPDMSSECAQVLASVHPYVETPAVPLSIKAGERRTVAAVWRKQGRECELLYEGHPGAGSLAFPGEAVIGIGKIGFIEVRHMVFAGDEEFYVSVEGPDVLDHGCGGWFGMGSDGCSLQVALNFLAMKIECVREWCDAVGKQEGPRGGS